RKSQLFQNLSRLATSSVRAIDRLRADSYAMIDLSGYSAQANRLKSHFDDWLALHPNASREDGFSWLHEALAPQSGPSPFDLKQEYDFLGPYTYGGLNTYAVQKAPSQPELFENLPLPYGAKPTEITMGIPHLGENAWFEKHYPGWLAHTRQVFS